MYAMLNQESILRELFRCCDREVFIVNYSARKASAGLTDADRRAGK
jgi:hypothetical protein